MTHEPLGELEQMVLLVIVRLSRESYGTPIVDELRRHTRRAILRPSVYLALKRLEAKGLIRGRMGEPEARRGGRARRYFEPTAAAMKSLRETQRAMNSLWDGVVLADKRKA